LALCSLENKDARARSGILKGLDGTHSPHRKLHGARVRTGRVAGGGPARSRAPHASGHTAASPGKQPDGRSLKTEERGQVATTGAGSVPGGLRSPKGLEAARHLPAYDDTK